MDLWIAAAPAVLLILLFIHLDRKRPEPLSQVTKVVLLGALLCFPAALIELIEAAALGDELIHAQGRVVEAFLVAALTEEVLKLSVVLVCLWRRSHFDEVMDGILYTVAASLGFALLENVLYSLGHPQLGLVRSITAVPLHAVASGIMGYCVGRARMAQTHVVAWLLLGLALSVVIHGFYDWTVFSGGGFGVAPPDALRGVVVVLPLVLVGALVLRYLVRHALQLDDFWLGPHSRRLLSVRPGRASGRPPMVMISSDVTAARAVTVVDAKMGHEP